MKYWKAGIFLLLVIFLIVGIALAPKFFLKVLEKQITDISIEEKAIRKYYFDLDVRINLLENSVPGFVDTVSYHTEKDGTIEVVHALKAAKNKEKIQLK